MADNEKVSAKRWVIVLIAPFLISAVVGFASSRYEKGKIDAEINALQEEVDQKADKSDIVYIKEQITVIREDQRKILERLDRHMEEDDK